MFTKSVNNLPLHFFKEKGAEVAGASLRFVKFASNPETGEDKDAILPMARRRSQPFQLIPYMLQRYLTVALMLQ